MMDFPGDVNTAMAIYFYRKEAAFLAALGCVVHKKTRGPDAYPGPLQT